MREMERLREDIGRLEFGLNDVEGRTNNVEDRVFPQLVTTKSDLQQ